MPHTTFSEYAHFINLISTFNIEGGPRDRDCVVDPLPFPSRRHCQLSSLYLHTSAPIPCARSKSSHTSTKDGDFRPNGKHTATTHSSPPRWSRNQILLFLKFSGTRKWGKEWGKGRK